MPGRPDRVKFCKSAVGTPRRFRWGARKLVVLSIFLPLVANAQDSSGIASRAMQSAFGFRAGPWLQKGERPDGILQGYYDIQLGDVLFSPTIDLLPIVPGVGRHNDSVLTLRGIGVETRVRISLGETPTSLWYLTTGFNFVVWPSDASVGLPLMAAYSHALSQAVQLEFEAGVTPSYYLATDRITPIFGILAGLRFPVSTSRE